VSTHFLYSEQGQSKKQKQKRIKVVGVPTLTTSQTEKRKRALVLWHTALVAGGLYLGVPQTAHAVQWMRDGRMVRLIA